MYLDDLMEGQAEQQKKAYELLKGKQATQSSNPEFLWRMCKSMYLMAVTLGQEGDSNAKQELIFEAVDYGEKALGEIIFLEFFLKSFILTKNFCGTFFFAEIDDHNAEAHKWFAIVIGSRGEYLGIKEKILDGFEFKKHIDRAAELSPQDHTIRHLLGR